MSADRSYLRAVVGVGICRASIALWLLAGPIFPAEPLAQEPRPTLDFELRVDDPRPVAAALALLERQHDWVITSVHAVPER